jgi:hypothetical protein
VELTARHYVVAAEAESPMIGSSTPENDKDGITHLRLRQNEN